MCCIANKESVGIIPSIDNLSGKPIPRVSSRFGEIRPLRTLTEMVCIEWPLHNPADIRCRCHQENAFKQESKYLTVNMVACATLREFLSRANDGRCEHLPKVTLWILIHFVFWLYGIFVSTISQLLLYIESVEHQSFSTSKVFVPMDQIARTRQASLRYYKNWHHWSAQVHLQGGRT